MLIYFFGNFIQYILIILFPVLQITPHPLHPTNILSFLQTKTRKEPLKMWNLICVGHLLLWWPFTPVMAIYSCPGVWLIYPVRSHWRKLMSHFPAAINCKYLLGRSWTMCPLSLLHAEMFVCLTFFLSCTCSHSLCEFICSFALLCLEMLP